MKKFFLSLILIISLVPAFAFEWGGLFTENAKVSICSINGNITDIASLSVRQSNGLSLWCKVPLKSDSSWYLASQASYRYNWDITLMDNYIDHIADLDLLKVTGTVKTSNGGFTLNAGRFIVMDNSGKIFNQNCDGVSAKYATQFISTSVYAGYTGLLNSKSVMILNEEGWADTGKTTGLPFYNLAHGYVPLTLSVDFPSLFLNQSLSFQAEAFFDVGKYSIDTLNKINRYYGSLSISGPIAGPCYYSLVTVFGTVDFDNIMNYSALDFQMYIKSISLKAGAEYASGKNGFLSPFIGFDSSTAYNSVYSPEYTGVILPQVEFGYSSNNFSTFLNGKLVLGIPESEIILRGIDFSLKTYWNILSDLQLEVSGVGYYDIYYKNAESFYALNVGLSLSF